MSGYGMSGTESISTTIETITDIRAKFKELTFRLYVPFRFQALCFQTDERKVILV